jgi:hypothetical protein
MTKAKQNAASGFPAFGIDVDRPTKDGAELAAGTWQRHRRAGTSVSPRRFAIVESGPAQSRLYEEIGRR